MAWTVKEIQYLKDNYLKLGAAETAKQLNKTVGAAYSLAHREGIAKSQANIKNLPSEAELRQYKADLRDILGIDRESSIC